VKLYGENLDEGMVHVFTKKRKIPWGLIVSVIVVIVCQIIVWMMVYR